MSIHLTFNAPRATHTRHGLSLIEVMVAVMILGIMMTFVGHISSSIAQANRRNDVIAKRTFAMQQQANIIGALPFSSLTATVLPASKNFTLGDFTYMRARVTLTTTGTAAAAQTTAITITIVPQTSYPSDTLLKESLHDAPQRLRTAATVARHGRVLTENTHDQSSSHHARDDGPGFSLIEVLACLVILGVLGTALTRMMLAQSRLYELQRGKARRARDRPHVDEPALLRPAHGARWRRRAGRRDARVAGDALSVRSRTPLDSCAAMSWSATTVSMLARRLGANGDGQVRRLRVA